jgi:hypothetical protein
MRKKRLIFLILAASLGALWGQCSRVANPLQNLSHGDQGIVSILGPSLTKTGQELPFYLRTKRLAQKERVQWYVIGEGEIVSSGSKAIWVRGLFPDTHFFLVCELYTSNDVLIARNSRLIRTFRQAVVLKADDFIPDVNSHIAPQWKRFVRFIREQNLCANIGVVGRFLEHPPENYRLYLLALARDARFELWNHGYYHSLIYGGDGRVFSEFFARSYRFQYEALERTQRVMKEKLGTEPHAFGAPGNLFDHITVQVLQSFPEIHVWFFGKNNGRQMIFPRTVEAEYPTGRPNLSVFATGYDPEEELVVLQLHPAMWDEKDFGEFVKIIRFLQKYQATFVLAEEYYQYRKWIQQNVMPRDSHKDFWRGGRLH